MWRLIPGSNLLQLASGFLRGIDEKKFIPHLSSLIASLIPCCKLSGPLADMKSGHFWYGPSQLILSDQEHVYGIIVLFRNASISTQKYSRPKNNGGKVQLRSMTDFIIPLGTGFNLTGKGYETGRGTGCTGGSVDSKPIRYSSEDSYSCNGGGGGPGYSGGYGTAGEGKYGGLVYGMIKWIMH